jgi:hypothetical protein
MEQAETKKCIHKMWQRIGLWDAKGMQDGGPMIECVDCGLQKNVTYPEWAGIEKDSKAEHIRVAKRPNWSKPIKK